MRVTDIAQLAGPPLAPPRRHNRSEYQFRFSVDGLHYEFTAINGGSVTFRVMGGATKIKAFTVCSWLAWDEDTAPYRGGLYFHSGIHVLRRVVALLVEWVRQEKPFIFHFHATDERRHRIFGHLVRRHTLSLADQYTHFVDGRHFWFVRKQECIG